MQRSFHPGLLRLLAVILLLQVALAPAVCLAGAAGTGLVLEICTAEGLTTRALDPTAEHQPPADAALGAGCLVCSALSPAAATHISLLSTPAWIGNGPGWACPPADQASLGIRDRPGGARAPPAFLG